MKKRYLFIMLFASLLLFAGCTNKKEEEKKKEEPKTKEISLKDEKSGYTIKFTFDEKEKFELTKTDTSGKFIEGIIQNEDYNMEMQIYFTEMTNTSYKSSKENRATKEGYKEYKWGKYEGYIYSVDKNSLNFNIMLLDGGDDAMSVNLFGAVYKIKYDGDDIMTENFEKDAVQKFMKSIEFTK